MTPNFWTVFKADALWSVCLLTVAILLQVGIKLLPGYWHRYRAKRKIKQALRYVAPELYDARKEELEVQYGLRPAPICGAPWVPPAPVQSLPCPYCQNLITVTINYPMIGPLGGGQYGDPGQSGVYPVPDYQHWCGTCRDFAKGGQPH